MAKYLSSFQRRQRRIRRSVKIAGGGRPRLTVFRSNDHIYAQVIDDGEGKTLVSASSLEKDFREKSGAGNNKDAAAAIGKLVAERAKKAKIKQVVFDRSGYLYHGRIKALGDAAREAGLEF
ncbi:MAG: 50S ribosomal protein L18 [Rhizobiales bacterium]|nr:50S ribosomal protein L18 [Hyphomicrobiales bacterium]